MVALFLWTGACWHLRPRDEWVGWDAVTRSERLQLIVHQARFLVLPEARVSVWSSAVLDAALRDLPAQWEEVFAYRPLLAETFTDPETHAGTCYKAREQLCATQLPAARPAGLAAPAGVHCVLKTSELGSLYDVFSPAADPHRRQARRYPIGAVLTLIALGLLRGAVHLSTLVRTAQKLTQAQRRQLRLPRKKGTRFHSVPCSDAFRSVCHGIDRQRLAGSLTRWLQSQAGELPRTLAIARKNCCVMPSDPAKLSSSGRFRLESSHVESSLPQLRLGILHQGPARAH